MRLAFSDDLIVTTHFDPEMAMLADRHYSRRTVGARQFLYSGRKLVIRDALGDVLFGWLYPNEDMRMDGQTGYNCAIFRNESKRKSSEIILECEQIAFERWGPNRGVHVCEPGEDSQCEPGVLFQAGGLAKRKESGRGNSHQQSRAAFIRKAGLTLLMDARPDVLLLLYGLEDPSNSG